jgi:hypothetical protein
MKESVLKNICYSGVSAAIVAFTLFVWTNDVYAQGEPPGGCGGSCDIMGYSGTCEPIFLYVEQQWACACHMVNNPYGIGWIEHESCHFGE